MANYDAADLLARVRSLTRTEGQTDFPSDTQFYQWLTEGENEIKGEVSITCPRALLSGPALMATADAGLTFTFGTDADGNAIVPFGQVILFRQLADYPDVPMEPLVDYVQEGGRIRAPANTPMASSFPSGAPYFIGILPTAGTTSFSLVPADKRVIAVYYAAGVYGRAGGAFDPTPYEQLYRKKLDVWIGQLQLQYANQGVVASTSGSASLSPRLRRVANTRGWTY